MPTLSRINVYPVKSFDGQSVESAVVLPNGALAQDRRFVLTDRSGQFINGKRCAAVHRVRLSFDPESCRLTVRFPGSDTADMFDLSTDRDAAAERFSAYLDQPVTIIENTDGGFPDDVESPGPTVISTATLAEVASWYPGLTADETRDRFRPNLEIEADEPFWEDRLVADGSRAVRFRIGEAEWEGSNPCARCPVPPRNPYTGEPIPRFAKTFAERRQATLPAWAATSRFDHFYRLTTNTRPVRSRPCTIRVGDEVEILDAL